MANTSDIYQLTPFQYDSLIKVANGDSPLIIVIEPLPDDKDELKERLEKQIREAKDLEVLGFVKDTSGSFLERITSAKMQSGRGFQVFLITEIGFNMFHGTNKRTAN